MLKKGLNVQSSNYTDINSVELSYSMSIKYHSAILNKISMRGKNDSVFDL
jgi:hypothetical protein